MAVNVEQVWATVTFNPNPPIDGQPFTITSNGGLGSPLSVYGSCGCNGGCSIGGGSVSPTTLTLAAGQYNVLDSGDGSCTPFTVDPAPSSYIPPVTIGGTILPVNRFLIVLPWITLVVILSTVAAYTLTTSRKSTKRK